MSFNQRLQNTSDAFSRSAAAANLGDGRPDVEPVQADVPPETYRVEYVTARGECWASNALSFDTVEDAEQEARDRSFRWTAVRLARVVPISTPTRQTCDYEDPGPVVVDYR